MADAAPSALSLLRLRRFAPLFTVQALGAFNDQVFKTAFVTLLTFKLADEMGLDITLHASLTGAVFILPFALFAPTAGMLADGIDKAKMMRWVKGFEIVLMGLAAVAYHVQSLPMLYGLLFLMGAQSAAFSPIKYGVLPQYLRENELVQGNGLIQGATFLAILLGQIAGAKLIVFDTGVTIVSIAVVAIAIFGFGASLFAPSAPPLGAAPKVDWVFPRAMWRVVKDGRKEPEAFRAVLGIAWFWMVGSAFLTQLPAFAKETLHADENVFILLLATFSVGVAVGAVLCARLFGTSPTIGTAAFGAGGIAVFAVILAALSRLNGMSIDVEGPVRGVSAFLAEPSAIGIIVCFALLAACAGLYLTPLNVLLQLKAPPNARGRFIACSNTIDALVMALASVFSGIFASTVLGIDGTYALFGGTGIIAALWCLREAKRSPDPSA